MNARSRLEFWLTVTLSLLAMAALVWFLPRPSELLVVARAVPAAIWLVAAAGMALSYVLRALRLQDEWAGRLRLGLREALHLVLLHSAAISFVPFRVGEAGYPWLLHRRHRVGLAASASSLLWLRLQDISVGLLLAWICVGPGLAAEWRALLALGTVLALALGGKRLARRGLMRLDTSMLASTGRQGFARNTARVLCQAVERAPPRVWLWTVLNWIVKMSASALLIAALLGLLSTPAGSAAAGWSASFAGAVLGEIGGALPLQPPAGFGPYEGGVLLGIRLQGLAEPVPAVLGAALVSHVFLLLLGGGYALASLWLDSALGGPSVDRQDFVGESAAPPGPSKVAPR